MDSRGGTGRAALGGCGKGSMFSQHLRRAEKVPGEQPGVGEVGLSRRKSERRRGGDCICPRKSSNKTRNGRAGAGMKMGSERADGRNSTWNR